jgi:hypothetical protein
MSTLLHRITQVSITQMVFIDMVAKEARIRLIKHSPKQISMCGIYLND